MPEAMLELEKLNIYYGNIHALQDVSLTVNKGEMVAIIGANGAGKTTTLAAISGLIQSKSGKIRFENQDITHAPTHQIVSSGISHVPEGRQIFSSLSVAENIRLGAYQRRDQKGIQEDANWIYSLFPVLKDRRSQIAGTLSGGEQQMLAIGRSVMSNPRLLLLDEPSMGLAPLIVELIFDVINQLKERGMTILLVEQNAYQALSQADRAYVLETGRIKLSGTSSELINNEEIQKAYLGG
ncbi:MAG: ABC transporter ATP-binding protein [Bacillota bacterium]|nr:ABC transporter ATP-binding protein [Bacillota bacterium]